MSEKDDKILFAFDPFPLSVVTLLSALVKNIYSTLEQACTSHTKAHC